LSEVLPGSKLHGTMQWLTLGNWIFVALLAAPVASIAIGFPSLGAHALAAFAGLAMVVVFAVNGDDLFAWISVGVGAVGILVLSIGAHSLMSDAPRTVSVGQTKEEMVAALVGLELPFFITAAILSAGTAIG
jgi:hypothetical protein